jgi:hypothetical protein
VGGGGGYMASLSSGGLKRASVRTRRVSSGLTCGCVSARRRRRGDAHGGVLEDAVPNVFLDVPVVEVALRPREREWGGCTFSKGLLRYSELWSFEREIPSATKYFRSERDFAYRFGKILRSISAERMDAPWQRGTWKPNFQVPGSVVNDQRLPHR